MACIKKGDDAKLSTQAKVMQSQNDHSDSPQHTATKECGSVMPAERLDITTRLIQINQSREQRGKGGTSIQLYQIVLMWSKQYLIESEAIFVHKFTYLSTYFGGKNTHYTTEGNWTAFSAWHLHSIYPLQPQKHKALEASLASHSGPEQWVDLTKTFTASRGCELWAQSTPSRWVLVTFCFVFAQWSVSIHLNAERRKTGQKKSGWYSELISFYSTPYNLKVIFQSFYREMCIDAVQETRQNE